MVSIENKLLFCCLCLILPSAYSSLLQSLLDDADPCEEVCQKTYPSHTYEKIIRDTFVDGKNATSSLFSSTSNSEDEEFNAYDILKIEEVNLSDESCRRGCRLYSIIELIGEEDGINGTMKACHENCKEAYVGDDAETSACILGCNSQKQSVDKWGHMMESDMGNGGLPQMMYPLLYMHNMYSNMVDKVTHHMSVSWSFFMQDGTGRLVVVRSQPQVVDVDDQDFDGHLVLISMPVKKKEGKTVDLDDYSPFRSTSLALETNLEQSDNTATEVLRHSQLKSARSLGEEINAAQADPWYFKTEDGGNNDWLSCIARKTGIPRLILCVVILLSAIAMIWLCLSAAVTAPDQRVLQKLSINGDLEYLRGMPNKAVLKGVHPQDFVEARPLPVKIRVDQI